jgi:hypothetical protein
MTKKKVKNTIPKFRSRKEEVDFWDKHSFADYVDESKPVLVKRNQQLEQILSVRFDGDTVNQLEVEADKKGIGATTLVRMWVKERLSA